MEEEEEEVGAVGENSGKETGTAANRRLTETREGLFLSVCLESFIREKLRI